jgi:hypothetical protein
MLTRRAKLSPIVAVGHQHHQDRHGELQAGILVPYLQKVTLSSKRQKSPRSGGAAVVGLAM